MARFTTLYSGSSGNCAVVEEDGAYILIDVGKSCRQTVNGLRSIGLSPEGLGGICVTHEHTDHVSGLAVFTKTNPGAPVASGTATLEYLCDHGLVCPASELLPADGPTLDIGGFGVTAFPTSHDAVGCCGYRITTPKGRVLAIATDLGVITPGVEAAMAGADLVAIEANYNSRMLQEGVYPYYLKVRIASRRGHLENGDSAAAVARLARGGCDTFAFCHLSQENNRPPLVLEAARSALSRIGAGERDTRLQVSLRNEVSPFIAF